MPPTWLTRLSFLDCPRSLAQDWPATSGVIKGTRRYLVADRMDITGARWSVKRAKAILKLRAMCANNDFDDDWKFHFANERQRVHESRCANGVIPRRLKHVAPGDPQPIDI